jgi:hypothetical protein
MKLDITKTVNGKIQKTNITIQKQKELWKN